MKPLRLQVLAWCQREAEFWSGKPVAPERVAEYLAGCERNGANIGHWLGEQIRKGVRVSFCAAARGFAEREAAREMGKLQSFCPPWRAGAREIMRDAQAGRRGVWVPARDARDGYRPPPGSAVIYWRESPQSWKGHIETLIEATDAGYRSIGANERGGRWWADVEPVAYEHPQLLGFVVDEPPDDTPETTIVDVPPVPEGLVDDEIDDDAIFARQFTTISDELREAMRREQQREVLG